jgi:hypothetical protein
MIAGVTAGYFCIHINNIISNIRLGGGVFNIKIYRLIRYFFMKLLYLYC